MGGTDDAVSCVSDECSLHSCNSEQCKEDATSSTDVQGKSMFESEQQTCEVMQSQCAEDSHKFHCKKCTICVQKVCEVGSELSVNTTTTQVLVKGSVSDVVVVHANEEIGPNMFEKVSVGVVDTAVEMAVEDLENAVDSCVPM